MSDEEAGSSVLTEEKVETVGAETPALKNAGEGEGGADNREPGDRPASSPRAVRLGSALRTARSETGMSLRGFAEACHRSHGPLSQYERGKHFAPKDVVADYARICGRADLIKLRETLVATGVVPPTPHPEAPASPKRSYLRWFLIGLLIVTVAFAAIGSLRVLSSRQRTSPPVRVESGANASQRVNASQPANPERRLCARTATVRDAPRGATRATLRAGEHFVIVGLSENGHWAKGYAPHAQDIEGFILLQTLSSAGGSCDHYSGG